MAFVCIVESGVLAALATRLLRCSRRHADSAPTFVGREPWFEVGAPQEKRPEKNDSIFAVLVSPVSQYTRTKSSPPLVLFKTKFSASQRVSKRQIFSESPPTGINSSSGSALRSGGNVEAKICAGPTCGPGVIKTRPECRYQPSARSYKRPKALKWIPRHIRCAVLFRTPRIAPELILRLQGAAERCRHSHTSQNNPQCASKQPWK